MWERVKNMDEIWNKIHKSREWGEYPSEYVIRFVARNYYNRQRNKVKILDFGCGGGNHTWYLAREGFDTYAFDGSEYAVDNARRKLEKENLNAHFSVYDGIKIEYDSDFFDAVIDNVCVYANTIDNIKKMYGNIYRVLKKNGKILTVCFGKKTFGYGLGKEIEEDTYSIIKEGPLHDRGISHFFDEISISEIVRKEGFSNIIIDKIIYTDLGHPVEQIVLQAEKL